MSPSLVNNNGEQYYVLSDFDSTITTADSTDLAVQVLGFGEATRRDLSLRVLDGMPFRDAFKLMVDSVAANQPFPAVVDFLVQRIGLDPGFKDFFHFCQARKLPLVIISSGLLPIVKAILENLLGKEDAAKLHIIANDVEYLPDGSWTIKFLHPESAFGHDKSISMAYYRDLPHKPTLFFCGDGISDLSAAKAADLLFVKVIPGHTNDLSVHCIRQKIPYVPFDHFVQVKDVVESVIDGKVKLDTLGQVHSE